MRVNNRKLAQGFYLGLGITDPGAVLRQVDKIDKIGPDRVSEQLINEVKITEAQARRCVQLAQIRSADASFVDQVRRLGVHHDQLPRGSSCWPRW
jgi:histidyl-tRNA synthetase